MDLSKYGVKPTQIVATPKTVSNVPATPATPTSNVVTPKKVGGLNLSKYGIKPEQVVTPPPAPKTGVVQSIVQSVANPFLKIYETGKDIVTGTSNISKALISKAQGKEQESLDYLNKVKKDNETAGDYGYFGKVQSINGPKDAIGTGLELGSYITPGGAVKGILGGGLKAALPKVAKLSAQGAISGSLTGAGTGLQENLSATDVAKRTLSYGATGAIAAPIIGVGSEAIGKGISSSKKALAPRIINSLVKPKQANFAYGKNPGRAVSEMGIIGNNLDDFTNNLSKAKNEVGSEIGNIYSSPANSAVKASAMDEILKIDAAITEAAKGGKNNQGIVTKLNNIKEALLFPTTVTPDGLIIKSSDIPKDLSLLNPEELFKLKQDVANMTQFTGQLSDDKTVNSVLKDIYGGIKQKLNKMVSPNNPEIIKLNEQYGDLISAEIAAVNREKIAQKSNLVGMPIKVGAIAGLLSGGITIPAVLTGITVGALEKAFESTAVKTRVARYLANASPSALKKLLDSNPATRDLLIKTFPIIAGKIGQIN